MQGLSRGVLIVVEGIDGVGKSTLTHNITHTLLSKQLPVVTTREPGITELGKLIRKMVQDKTVPICAKAEYLLFASNRAQHFEELVIPNLHEKKIVLSDRMADSSLVYQGFGRGLDLGALKTINAWCMNDIVPDITIYLQLDPAVAVDRLRQRGAVLSSFEKEKASFTQKLAVGFETIFADRDDVLRLDGMRSPEQLTEQAVNHIMSWIENNGLCV
ncbi:MAG TPA: dTMP kinase [Candidatus Babeliales bacterium]|nr:dTMP kinase [Candidatus Babeliales bacterium]